MQVAVIGAGYVGLVTAACLARLGQDVRVIDVDARRIAGLRAGRLPIGEPGLDELVAEGVAAGRLSFHDDATAVRGTFLAIVCVGTLDDRGEWNGDVVREATVGLAGDPDGPRRLVIRSTLMPGTAVTIAAAVAAVDPSVAIALNPEFTREGSAIDDFFAPDRVVIGIADAEEQSGFVDDLRSLYAKLPAPVIVTDLTTAIAVLGLGFKAGVDDTRESPGLPMTEDLVARGAEVVLSDPTVDTAAMAASVSGPKRSDRVASGHAEGTSSIEDACRDADAVIVATADARYRTLDWGPLAATMRGRVVLDATGIVDPATARDAGLDLMVLGAPLAAGAEVAAVR